MSIWRDEVPTSGAITLPPDPDALDALGRNHSLPTALADLVDNSIDAHATHVLIRSIRQGGRLCALYVVDNGDGIRPDSIDAAMTVGRRRDYGLADLGSFGLGMKAASFSQAQSMTVLSQAADAPPVGRRWQLADDKRDFWGAPKFPDSPSNRMDVWKGEVIASTEEELLTGIQR